MKQNETLAKIAKLMEERKWSLYKLAKESSIPYSSLNSMFQKNNQPTLSTLEKLCAGFHISMAEFFSDSPPYRMDSFSFTEEEIELIEMYRELNKIDQKLFITYTKGFAKKEF